MKIALLGATRGTGKYVLELALERGHQVTALVRDVTALPQRERLTVVNGDARQVADVAKVVSGADLVVSSIGARQISSRERVVSSAAAATAEAMKQLGMKRIIFVSALGAGQTGAVFEAVAGLGRLLAPGIIDTVIDDKDRAEALIRDAGLDYTFVRAPALTDGPKTGRYHARAENRVGLKKISRADLAAFIVDEAEQPKFVRAAPMVIG
jgi:putative NADH-flavin reductase